MGRTALECGAEEGRAAAARQEEGQEGEEGESEEGKEEGEAKAAVPFRRISWWNLRGNLLRSRGFLSAFVPGKYLSLFVCPMKHRKSGFLWLRGTGASKFKDPIAFLGLIFLGGCIRRGFILGGVVAVVCCMPSVGDPDASFVINYLRMICTILLLTMFCDSLKLR